MSAAISGKTVSAGESAPGCRYAHPGYRILPILPPLPLAPFRNESHERGERRRRLSAARVVQKRPRKRGAPIVKHADQRAGLDAVANVALECQPEARAVMHGAQRKAEIG